jgi:putative hydrolase of the HAD superfamily
MKTKTYKHLFFDLDHTLWDFDRNAALALSEVYGEFGLETILNGNFDEFYRKYLVHNEMLWKRYHNGFITAEDLKWKRMWRTLLEYQLADETLSKDLSKRFLEVLPLKKEVFPYTFEILAYLQKKGYAMHIITNGFEKTQWSKLENSGMIPFFGEVITSEMSNSVKPQKEIFDHAMLRTGAAPESSIMIGDNPEADIEGARTAGMDSVFVNHDKKDIDPQPTYTVYHLKELEGIL